MEFEWEEVSDTAWHLLVVPGRCVEFDSTASVAMAYHYIEMQGWKGVVYANLQYNYNVFFPEMENLEDMKLLLETTVALRQG